MSASFVQSKSTSTSGSASVSVTLTSTPTTGNVILVFAVDANGSGSPRVTGVVDGNSNTVASLIANPNGTSDDQVVFAYIVPATPSKGFTASFSGLGGEGVLVQEWSGIPSITVDGTAGTAGSASATTLSATYSSSASGEPLWSFFGDNGVGDTVAALSGYTMDTHNINNSNNANTMVAYKAAGSSGGSEANSWSLSAGGAERMFVITFAIQLSASSSSEPDLIMAFARGNY